jgi:hypothetical protein
MGYAYWLKLNEILFFKDFVLPELFSELAQNTD